MFSAILEAFEKHESQEAKKQKKDTVKHSKVNLKFPPPEGVMRYRRNSFYKNSSSAGALKITELQRHKYEKDNRLLAQRLEKIYLRKPLKKKRKLKLAINREDERYIEERKIRIENIALARRLRKVHNRSGDKKKAKIEQAYASEIPKEKPTKQVEKSKLKAGQSKGRVSLIMTEEEFEEYCRHSPNTNSFQGRDFEGNLKSKPETYLFFNQPTTARSSRGKADNSAVKRENIRLYRRLSTVKPKISCEVRRASTARKASQTDFRKSVHSTVSRPSSKMFSPITSDDFRHKEKQLLEHVNGVSQSINDNIFTVATSKDDLQEKKETNTSTETVLPKLDLTTKQLQELRNNIKAEKERFDETDPASERIIREFVLDCSDKALLPLKESIKRNKPQAKKKVSFSDNIFHRSFKRRLSIGLTKKDMKNEKKLLKEHATEKLRKFEITDSKQFKLYSNEFVN